jgi:hypothetical protein
MRRGGRRKRSNRSHGVLSTSSCAGHEAIEQETNQTIRIPYTRYHVKIRRSVARTANRKVSSRDEALNHATFVTA